MDFNEVKTWMETNKDQEDVKNYLSELSRVTAEGVEGFINTEDGKKWIGKQNDSFFTKGLESWKNNNLEKIIEEEISKRNPAETPEQKKIRELEQRLNQKEADEKRQILKNQALTLATSKKLPVNIIDFFLGDSEDSTTQNLTKLEEVLNKHITAAVEERFKNGYKPPTNSNTAAIMTLAQFNALPKAEQERMTREDWSTVSKILANNQ